VAHGAAVFIDAGGALAAGGFPENGSGSRRGGAGRHTYGIDIALMLQ
jgi:hypothetical protein